MSKRSPLEKTFLKISRIDWAILDFIERIRKPWFNLMEQFLIVGVFVYLSHNGPRNIVISIISFISIAIFTFGLFTMLKVVIINPVFKRFLRQSVSLPILVCLYFLVLLGVVWFVTNYLINFFSLLGR